MVGAVGDGRFQLSEALDGLSAHHECFPQVGVGFAVLRINRQKSLPGPDRRKDFASLGVCDSEFVPGLQVVLVDFNRPLVALYWVELFPFLIGQIQAGGCVKVCLDDSIVCLCAVWRFGRGIFP